jgi:hypothetical protein
MFERFKHLVLFLTGLALLAACVFFAKSWSTATLIIMAALAVVFLLGTDPLKMIAAIRGTTGGSADQSRPPDQKNVA